MSRRGLALADAQRWMQSRGLSPFPFQREVWRSIRDGESGLLHATTGSGKTLAAWLGCLLRVSQGGLRADAGLRLVWVTPMRALAADTLLALREPLGELGGGAFAAWEVGLRTGDTGSAERQRQSRRMPPALVTTPESLSLMLARADADSLLGGVCAVVVDEWHELLGNKRGVQLQLALARMRSLNPDLVQWGLSATLGNLDEALDVLLAGQPGRIVRGRITKRLVVDTLLPDRPGRFPWAGHLGLAMLEPVVREIDQSTSCLVFCNTRAQAELWYQALLDARPDWAGTIALHHGSLDRDVREWVETGLKTGQLRAVVSTSSLDLGVDFAPVERVLQIGSAKGVARLLQRAGRSGHSPGRPSRVTLVPTHALELLEAAAVQDAVAAGRIEAREPPVRSLDVLAQHLVTLAVGPGFDADALLDEVRSTHAFRDLTDEAWRWALDFVVRGGPSLVAYPDHHRVKQDPEGRYRVIDRRLARRHRMSIGTIVADSAMQVRFMTGQRLGTVEEGFISRLSRGDCFLFAGRLLELVRVHEMTAWVRRASGRRSAVPRWNGGRMPLSSEIADSVLERLGEAARGRFDGPEMRRLQPLLELQQRVSALPRPSVLLVESLRSREGFHLFVYPFAGRQAHLGIASLWAWRMAREEPASFSIAVNDYGFELLSAQAIDDSRLRDGSLLSLDGLADDVLASLNSGELALRRFREIARIAGLLFPGYPGAGVATRQLQASASLFWEVFRQHDPGNLLLGQARNEVLERELDIGRLRDALDRIADCSLQSVTLERPSPLAFPLMVERLRERLSTEKLSERVARLVAELERAAGA
jgi:ATP-dependent helicase Lhr and Lhr-like helicase